MRGSDGIHWSGKDAASVSTSSSTLIEVGLDVIDRMRRSTGTGEPERGEVFRLAGRRLHEAGDLIFSAEPQEWAGAGAEAYGLATRRHARRVAAVATLDRAAHAILARQADQIVHHRSALDDEADRLARWRQTSQDVVSTPGVGAAMKAVFELAAVNAALDACSHVVHRLTQQVSDNTDELRDIADEYAALADDAPAPIDTLPERDPAVGVDDDEPATSADPAPGIVATGAPTTAPTGSQASPQPPSAMPMEAMSALTSAVGAASGAIGATVAPVAAALTGAVGAAAQALSTPSVSAVADDVDTAVDEPATAEDDEPAPGQQDEDDRKDDAGPDPVEKAAPAETAAEPPPLLPPAAPTPAAPTRPPR